VHRRKIRNVLLIGLLMGFIMLSGCGEFTFMEGSYWLIRIANINSQKSPEFARSYSGLGSPFWSPVEDKIVCWEKDNGILLFDVTSGEKAKLFNLITGESVGAIEWSPDGEKIACVVSHASDSYGLYILNKNATTEASLSSSYEATYLDWSEDGSKLIFVQNKNIYSVNSNGSDLRQLTDDAFDKTMPSWSQDPTKVLYNRAQGGASYEVYLVDANGTNQRELANGEEPRWSPDGTKISFVSGEAIYLMNGDGANLQKLADGEGPRWSPDGTQISFISAEAIYLISPSSLNAIELVSAYRIERNSSEWSPDSKNIFYLADETKYAATGIYVFNIADKQKVFYMTFINRGELGNWSPDSSRFVYKGFVSD